MTALAGRKALVKVSGDATTFTDEATTADATKKIYKITNAAKNCWSPTDDITVTVDDVEVTTGFTIERIVGRVTFAASQSTSVVTVSGKYLPLSTCAGCRQFSVAQARDFMDASEFGDTWKKGVSGMLSISGSLSRWYQSDTYFFDAITAETPIVIELFANSADAFVRRVWARIKRDDLAASVDSLVDQPLEWSGTKDDDGNVTATA